MSHFARPAIAKILFRTCDINFGLLYARGHRFLNGHLTRCIASISLCRCCLFCVAETSDIKAYLTFSKTIQRRFGCFKNQGFAKASLEFKTVAGTLQKCVFMKQESKKRHEHERTVISVGNM